jgi:hypothetical protein
MSGLGTHDSDGYDEAGVLVDVTWNWVMDRLPPPWHPEAGPGRDDDDNGGLPSTKPPAGPHPPPMPQRRILDEGKHK